MSLCGCFERSLDLHEPAPYGLDGGVAIQAEPPSHTERADPQSPRALRLGSWNVRRLGSSPQLDVGAVARVIEAHFDLVALQEVMADERGGHPGYDALRGALGAGWSGQITERPRPEVASPFAEHYAVLMRNWIAPSCDLAYVLAAEDPARAAFLREPAAGCFEVRDPGSGATREIVLGVYHARWAEGRTAEIQGEVRMLPHVVTALLAARGEGRAAFFVGDFNLTDELLEATLPGLDRTSGGGSTLVESGAISPHLYDHVLVLNDAAGQLLQADAEVLDVRSVAASAGLFRARVSDHLPIRALLR